MQMTCANRIKSQQQNQQTTKLFIHSHFTHDNLYLHHSRALTTITVTRKSSHLKVVLQRHMQQRTDHNCVQYVCVYVCVSECRCAVCVWRLAKLHTHCYCLSWGCLNTQPVPCRQTAGVGVCVSLCVCVCVCDECEQYCIAERLLLI